MAARGGDDADDSPPPSPQKAALKWALEAEASASGTPKVDLPSGATTPNHVELQPPLIRLRRSLASSESCAFGSIRFPGRVMPAKYVRLARDSRVDVLVSLLVDTWRLESPCAVLALNPAATTMADDPPMSPRLELILRRGLAEAAHQTHGWVFTCGERSNFGAQAAGHAQAYGVSLGYEFPVIAVVATNRMVDGMQDVTNGKVYRYGTAGTSKASPNPSPTGLRGSSKAAPKQPAGQSLTLHDLDSRHTHFVMSDGGLEGADALRDRLEYYISSQDVSGDGIQTPKLLVVINGDVSTLEWVRGGLDDQDPATLTAVPVLVIAESGGAASDIWRYCSPESDTYLELPKVDSRHDEAYVAACARLLPEIEELGKQTGTNSTQQMNFYVIDPDPDADNDNDLVLAIQTALLNDCPDINQEAMLAVAWGQAVILQRHLESDAANLLAPTQTVDDDKPPPDDLLQIALQHKDVNVVQTLLDFTADPTNLVLDELFKEEFDRYPLAETKGLWLKPKIRKRPKIGMEGVSPPKSVTSPAGKASLDAALLSMPDEGGDKQPSLCDKIFGAFSSVGGLNSKQRAAQHLQAWPGAAHAQQVLDKMVDGYATHLNARKDLAESGGGVGIVPTFTDLMMWAVLAGQHDLATVLWAKAEYPLRAALMASQLCQRLSTNPKLRADSDELTESFMAYEDLAIELLDAVRESDDAAPLLTLMPWEWTAGKGKGNVGRELLWKDSPLDSSSMEDGMLSLPCMRFVAHRHCQYTLDKYFAGDYPGSKARIRHSATLVGIALQSLLPFLPGTIVEVMPVVEKPNSKLKGEEVEKEYQSQLGDGEMDPDLIDAIDAVAHAGEAAAAETAEALEGTLEDMVGDLSSWRWLHFYSVPKVKFTVHFCCYVAYMFYAAFVLMRQHSAEGSISGYEIFFWVWALSRQVGEV